MASIRQRKGSWQARVIRKGFPPLAATFSTKRDAEVWASQQEADIGRGRFIDSREAEKTTLKECLERYQREVSSTKKGFHKERSVIARWLRSGLEARAMSSIRGMDIAGYRDARLKQVSAHTVGNELILLSHLFNVARREWGMEGLQNPVASVRRPKRPRARDRRLKPGEEDQLLAAAAPNLRRAIILALETGMRLSELTRLQPADLDLTARVASLRDTKNGESRRVPLSPRAISVLQEGLIGCTSSNITHSFAKLSQSLGIEGLRFHDLRHEATSRLFERGLNPIEVASITGHKGFAMLQRYTHLKASDLARRLDVPAPSVSFIPGS